MDPRAVSVHARVTLIDGAVGVVTHIADVDDAQALQAGGQSACGCSTEHNWFTSPMTRSRTSSKAPLAEHRQPVLAFPTVRGVAYPAPVRVPVAPMIDRQRRRSRIEKGAASLRMMPRRRAPRAARLPQRMSESV